MKLVTFQEGRARAISTTNDNHKKLNEVCTDTKLEWFRNNLQWSFQKEQPSQPHSPSLEDQQFIAPEHTD